MNNFFMGEYDKNSPEKHAVNPSRQFPDYEHFKAMLAQNQGNLVSPANANSS